MHAVLNKGEYTFLATCPVCGGTEFSPVRKAFDDRYGHPGSFALAHCRQCSHLMTLPRLNEQDLPHLYGTYYPRKSLTPQSVSKQAAIKGIPFVRLWRWWMGVDNQGQYAVRPGDKMLDVGCGSGASLLEAQALGAQAFGVEADPNVEGLARALGLQIHLGSIGDRPFPELMFDLIILNQVIEHIPEPDKALALIANRLAPGGRVVLVFPNHESFWCRVSGPSWINWHIPYHLHHFNAKTFARLAARCGFEVIRSRSITPNLWTLLQLQANLHPAVRGQPSSLWQVQSAKRDDGQTDKKPILRPVRHVVMLIALNIIAVFNRCIDLLGQGDSLMVELRRVTSK